MSKAQEERDLQKFLRDVDEITNLIQGLNSTDTSVQKNAIRDADKKLSSAALKDENKSKSEVNRTLINTQSSVCSNQEEMMSPESFMSAVEKDASERAKMRKKNEALANAWKEKGNDAFSKGDYAGAIKKYTKGLKKQKDMQVLYTNRAQAYIKLQEYEKAINDCDWALRCDENCVKAFFHMGKAYLALKQYGKARECYQKILETDPQKEKLCKDCISEIDLEEKRQLEEERAMEELRSGEVAAVSASELLQKLSRPDENILYYTGGIQLLTEIIQDCTGQTLFRTSNGFSIISENEIIRRVFNTRTISPAEVGLSLSLLRLWQAVCKENGENQRLLLTHPDVNMQLPALLLSEVLEIQEQCLALLSLYTKTEHGRSLLVRHLDMTKYCISVQGWHTQGSTLGCKHYYEAVLGLRGPTKLHPTKLQEVSFWEGRADDHTKEFAEEITKKCLSLFNSKDGRTVTRAVGLLSHALPASLTAVEEAVNQDVMRTMIRFLKAGGPTTTGYALKTLAVCVRSSRRAQEEVVKQDGKCYTLLKLLRSENEMVAGNAAFCLGKCLEVPGTATKLLDTDVVKFLLKLTVRDVQKVSVQENAAVALGKLCTADPRHVSRLRELNGMAVLSDSMKHLQIH